MDGSGKIDSITGRPLTSKSGDPYTEEETGPYDFGAIMVEDVAVKRKMKNNTLQPKRRNPEGKTD